MTFFLKFILKRDLLDTCVEQCFWIRFFQDSTIRGPDASRWYFLIQGTALIPFSDSEIEFTYPTYSNTDSYGIIFDHFLGFFYSWVLSKYAILCIMHLSKQNIISIWNKLSNFSAIIVNFQLSFVLFYHFFIMMDFCNWFSIL